MRLRKTSEGPWYLYRWYDADGWLLYVGITNGPQRRAGQHMRRSWWTQFAAVVDLDPKVRCSSLAEAVAIEVAVIEAERPIFNARAADAPLVRQVNYLTSRGKDPAVFARHMAYLAIPAQRSPDLPATARRSKPLGVAEMLPRKRLVVPIPPAAYDPKTDYDAYVASGRWNPEHPEYSAADVAKYLALRPAQYELRGA